MKNPMLTKRNTGVGIDSIQLISLFMTWFLGRERLAQDTMLSKWFVALEKTRAEDFDKWAGYTRHVLFDAAAPSLRATLERPLTKPEKIYLAGYVREFVEIYGLSRLQAL